MFFSLLKMFSCSLNQGDSPYAILGALTSSFYRDEALIFSSLSISAFRLLVDLGLLSSSLVHPILSPFHVIDVVFHSPSFSLCSLCMPVKSLDLFPVFLEAALSLFSASGVMYCPATSLLKFFSSSLRLLGSNTSFGRFSVTG